MAKLTPKDFAGTRARLFRLHDSKIFHGWVRNVFGSRVEVVSPTDQPVQIGEKYRFELHGRRTSAVFDASLESVEPFDMSGKGDSYAVEGSNVRIIEASWVVLQFYVDGQFRYSNAIKPFRARADGVKAQILVDGETVYLEVIDVSQQGLAVKGFMPLSPGLKVGLVVETPIGSVRGSGTIRNCRSEDGHEHRIGIELDRMGRIDQPRWDRFVSGD